MYFRCSKATLGERAFDSYQFLLFEHTDNYLHLDDNFSGFCSVMARPREQPTEHIKQQLQCEH